ncbi:MAG: altronate dehydratase, partial [Selenomonadaceae bacterium]|nr:altronate dehydratase [Selenomonadaceae bacterium]
MTNAILLDGKDNVATCTAAASAGEKIKILGGGEIVCVEDIPIWHKVALKKIGAGEKIFKYGEIIGEASEEIAAGGWVSHENIFSVPRDYESEMKESFQVSAFSCQEKIKLKAESSKLTAKFYGYKRTEGRAGIRNHVLILPTCACGSETARIVASQVRGAVNIIFNTGCSDVQANTDMSQKILTGFACNPNVYGVVIIGLGCETVPHAKLREKIKTLTRKPVVSFGIQEEGGTLKTIEKAVRAARDLAAEAGLQQKELCDISELLLGIECGGSDATSGIASNPAVGALSDKLVDLGASTLMSESIEWIGGEHVLAKRAATPELHNKIIKICADYEAHLKAAGQDCRAGQPTPGNKFGGLSTIDEKSLGCIRKGGTRPIVEVLNQAERPTKRGAIVMDTAGYDISSVTSMA